MSAQIDKYAFVAGTFDSKGSELAYIANHLIHRGIPVKTGGSDITMMYSVTDVQGLNNISKQVLGNAAHALAASSHCANVWTKKKTRFSSTLSGQDHGYGRKICILKKNTSGSA